MAKICSIMFCIVVYRFRTFVRLKAGKHRIGIGGSVNQADFRQLQTRDLRLVQLIVGGNAAADGKALVNACFDLRHGNGIDDMRHEKGSAVIFHVDFNCRSRSV
ncbi:Uncharacterised protein [Neisseria meningitidis]|nr:hypothetical protein NM97021_0604 [Neisseria meningitidis 97021]ELK73278.1 hypothetical protein NM2006087_0739 [Neisseria meningitidis 2006087]ELK76832.1 hypothetical protein NM97014_1745 [Neisseria meningitidis 97014]ELK77494.1 hypothetical protein NM2002038_0593 [Neisseria meningitidis 2002038]EOC50352.1 hypothetical protein NM2005172_1656 [Neisseria meningitidis 2005172]EOC51863.1 hypothetical protein NM2008223_1605 [Neisseria meningitidis 2008223]EPF54577.1 hypothetical protein NM98002